jgi:hypothetical protein
LNDRWRPDCQGDEGIGYPEFERVAASAARGRSGGESELGLGSWKSGHQKSKSEIRRNVNAR